MRVIIAGDRECTDVSLVEKAIAQAKFDITEVVSGGARGIDAMGELWARYNNIPTKVFEADWNDITAPNAIVKTRINPWNKKHEQYNAGAGFARNEQMAEYAEALIAIEPHGPTSGTQDMIKRAKAHNLPVYIYEKPDEDYEYQF
jgi:predicted Rossmann fold nucleotide-binding protein DprA/Smf involved in DNA uptake